MQVYVSWASVNTSNQVCKHIAKMCTPEAKFTPGNCLIAPDIESWEVILHTRYFKKKSTDSKVTLFLPHGIDEMWFHLFDYVNSSVYVGSQYLFEYFTYENDKLTWITRYEYGLT